MAHACVLADSYLPVHNAALDHRAGFYDRIIEDNTVAHERALSHLYTGGKNAVFDRALDLAAVREERPVHGRGRPELDRRAPFAAGMHDPLGCVEIERRLLRQQTHIGVPVGLHRAGVGPIAGVGIAGDVAARHQLGQNMLTNVIAAAAAQEFDQIVAPENVDAHISQVLLRSPRLFLELDDAVVGVLRNYAETVGLVAADASDGDRHRRPHFEVMRQEGPVIHQIDVLAGKNQHALLFLLEHVIQIPANGVGGAALPVTVGASAVGLKQPHAAAGTVKVPGLADPDMIVQAAGAVLGQHGDVVNAAVDAVAEGEVDQTELAGERNRGLRTDLGQDTEVSIVRPGHDHGKSPGHSKSSPIRSARPLPRGRAGSPLQRCRC